MVRVEVEACVPRASMYVISSSTSGWESASLSQNIIRKILFVVYWILSDCYLHLYLE